MLDIACYVELLYLFYYLFGPYLLLVLEPKIDTHFIIHIKNMHYYKL